MVLFHDVIRILLPDHLDWDRALDAIETLLRFGMRVRRETIGRTNEAAFSAVARAMELRTYLEYNRATLVDNGRRRRSGKAISTSRADGRPAVPKCRRA